MIERVQAYRVSTSTAPLYLSRGALEETLQTRSASLRISVKKIVTLLVKSQFVGNNLDISSLKLRACLKSGLRGKMLAL